ncbi:thiazole synthase [Nocardiopsis sp. HNM0947]|uniref:thiazole synthase n=1 Tax=Nocardiopsis coralli TaxID=2772213 RepID=A0ABR9PE45_9ACTN|nr:thiazole synthase [Nocardiopsis coralli]MBE3002000.1 thiazole synthase [Nocardiopsis coralli]
MTVTTERKDVWHLGGVELTSRLMLAVPETAPMEDFGEVLEAGRIQSATIKVSPMGESGADGSALAVLREHGVHVLPNTVDAGTVDEAVQAAHHGAVLAGRPWVKLIMTEDHRYNTPLPGRLLAASERLITEGFEVFPLTTDDPGLAEELAALGCSGLMPQGSPAGSGQGVANPLKFGLIRERNRIPLLAGAGIGTAAHACEVMEAGYDGVASAKVIFSARDRVRAATALADAVAAGREIHLASAPR